MAGELNFKAVFDYGDAEKSVDELYGILESGAVKMNEAFSFGRMVNANKKELRDMLSATKQTLNELEAVYKSTMDEVKKSGGLEYVSQQEREYLENLRDGIDSARKMIAGLNENIKEQNFNKDIFSGLIQGLQGVMGAFTAARGIMAQFGAGEEDLVKVQTKLQASMSILMGVQQVYNTLQSTSAFRMQISAKATELLAKTQQKLAISAGLAKVALGGLAVVLGAVVAALTAYAVRQSKNKDLSKEYTDQVVSDVSKQMLAYKKLQVEWKNANGELEKQRKILASDEWKNLGLAVNGINDAEKALVSQSDAVVRAFVARAKAAALLAAAQEDINKAVSKELKAEQDEGRAESGDFNFLDKLRAGFFAGDKNVFARLFKRFEYEDAERPQSKDFKTAQEYERAIMAYNARMSAKRKRTQADEATKQATEKIEQSINYDEEGNRILSELGLIGSGAGGTSVASFAKFNDILARQQKELKRMTDDYRNEIRQAEINAMGEGVEKTLQQIDLNFKKEEEAITRWYDDLIDEKIARDKELWEANPENKGQEFVPDRSKYGYTKEEQDLFKARNAANINNQLAGRQAVLDQYLTFAEKFSKSATGFQKDIKALKDAGAGINAIGVASKQAEESFTALAKAWAESGWDEGLVEMTILLNDLESQLEIFGDELPEEQVALLVAQINALKEAMKESEKETEENTTAWTDLHKVLSDSATLFDQIGSSIGGPFGEAIAMVGKFASAFGQIANGVEAMKKAKTATESFSAGVSIASAAISIYSSIANKVREAQENTDALVVATAKYERMLERIKDSRALDTFINAFGTNALGSFVANLDIARDARGNIDKLLASFIGGYKGRNDTFAETLMEQMFPEGLVSDMRTNFQKWLGVGGNNIFTASLQDFFDENGNLLGEELQEWYQTYGEGLAAEDKKLVEALIDEWQRWEDAMKAVNDYLTQLFNNVSGSIADKMVENFIETGNAIVDMTDYLDDFSRKLAKSIIQGQLMKQVFTEAAQDEIGQLIAQGQIAEAVNYYNSLLGQANELAPAFGEWLQQIDLKDAVKGQSATAGGFQTMSQDVANELNGRFAALQIAGENILLESRGIHADTTGIAASAEALQGLALISMGHLEDIAKYTSVLPDMSERVINIEKYSKQMVS